MATVLSDAIPGMTPDTILRRAADRVGRDDAICHAEGRQRAAVFEGLAQDMKSVDKLVKSKKISFHSNHTHGSGRADDEG
ncbi:MAG: hypothetical protein R3B51_02435 [Thermodesulfobacteriota bacterium]